MGYSFEAGKKTDNVSSKLKTLVSKAKNIKKLKNFLPKKSKSSGTGFAPVPIESKTSIEEASSPSDYSYSSSKSSKTSKLSSDKAISLVTNNKVMLIGVIIILAAIAVIGTNITGYMTYTETLAVELNETQQALAETVTDFSVCQNDLIICASSRTTAETELGNCEVNMSFYKGKHESLTVTYEELKNNYDDLRADYDNLASLVDQLKSLLS